MDGLPHKAGALVHEPLKPSATECVMSAAASGWDEDSPRHWPSTLRRSEGATWSFRQGTYLAARAVDS